MNGTNQLPESREDALKDVALRELLQASLPEESASPQLRQRIERLEQETRQKLDNQVRAQSLKRRTQMRLAWSIASIALMLTVVGWLWPRFLISQALARVEAAMAKVASSHIVRYRIENGKRIKESETWFQKGQWRIEDPERGFTQIYAQGKNWSYSARENTVKITKNASGPYKYNQSGFTLSDLTRDFQKQGENPSVSLLGESTLNGRKVKRALFETKTDYETTKITFLVDAETDLPIQGDLVARNVYGKEGRWQFTMDYNRPFKPELFKPVFARSAKFVDLAKQSDDWKKRLAKGLVSKRVGQRTIAIREIQVNERGDVFVFYTAGKRADDKFQDGENMFAGHDWKMFLQDSLGTKYHWMRSSLQFQMGEPYMVGGERLECDWWTPDVAPSVGQKWQPRTFTVNVKANPLNLHGGEKASFKPDYSATASFQLSVDNPVTPVVPTLVPALGVHWEASDIIQQSSEERGDLPPGVHPSPQLMRRLDGEAVGVFSPDSQLLGRAIAGGVQISKVSDGQEIKVLETPSGYPKSPVANVQFSPDGKTVLATVDLQANQGSDPAGDKTESNKQVFVWDRESGKLRATWLWKGVPDYTTRKIQISPDGETLWILNSIITKRDTDGKSRWVAAMNGDAQERDLLTGKLLSDNVLPHGGFIRSMNQIPTNTTGWLVATSQDVYGSGREKLPGVVRIWDGKTGQLLRSLDNPDGYDTGTSRLSNQGNLVAVVGQKLRADGMIRGGADEIRLFSPVNGELLNSIHPETSSWYSDSALALSPDGSLVAAENTDHSIGVWNTKTGQLHLSLVGHYAALSNLTFSTDGKKLLSKDIKDRNLLWNLG